MKRSLIAFAVALMAVSGAANAKIRYVDGIVKDVEPETNTISIVEDESGEVITYTYHDKAKYETGFGSKSMDKVRKGEAVTLKLQTAKAE